MTVKPEHREGVVRASVSTWAAAAAADADALDADTGDEAVDEAVDEADADATAPSGIEAPDAASIFDGEAPCSMEEERALLEQARSGSQAARERLVRLCHRSVVWTARRYRHSGVPLDDLVSEGMMGVLTAIDRFDLGRGLRFDTYSRWWVLDAMRNCVLRQSRIVRLPANVIKEIGAMERELKAIAGAHADAGSSRSVVEQVARKLRRTSDHVEHLMSLREPAVSLDAEVPASHTSDATQASAETVAAVAQLREHMLALMGSLDDRERHILRARYGLDTGVPATLSEVAAALGLTAERVRQLQREALVKLRRVLVERGMLGSGDL